MNNAVEKGSAIRVGGIEDLNNQLTSLEETVNGLENAIEGFAKNLNVSLPETVNELLSKTETPSRSVIETACRDINGRTAQVRGLIALVERLQEEVA